MATKLEGGGAGKARIHYSSPPPEYIKHINNATALLNMVHVVDIPTCSTIAASRLLLRTSF